MDAIVPPWRMLRRFWENLMTALEVEEGDRGADDNGIWKMGRTLRKGIDEEKGDELCVLS